ncbi:MAG TPA: SRPBCC family protein, partial [Thermoanaerobaculia bacterium]|nr:SRPBCC family protein [Thermoanaerobaculia bacterium]
KAGRDLRNRLRGMQHAVVSTLRRSEAPDAVVQERVRARMGRFVSHPSSIEVEVQDGRVTLTGPILEDEAHALLPAVRRVPGVREVVSLLDYPSDPGGVPGLQRNWAPATRVLAGATGGALVAWGASHRRGVGIAAAICGGSLLIRSVTNTPLRRLVGRERPTRAVDLTKTLTVRAPLATVWKLWESPERFPDFMEHLAKVERIAENRYHWEAHGPAGSCLTWDAEVTREEPQRQISWRSLPGSDVGTEGTVRFESAEDGATRLHIRMSYNPPGGLLGHLAAALLREDAKHALDDDLVRLKSLLEDGKTTAHGQEVTLGQLPRLH